MKFEKFAIADEIKENLYRMGFIRTTDIQYKVIPAVLNGEDVLAIAQTGSGKTAAFAIPIINLIHQFKTSKRTHSLKCLIMVPTRELAQQIGEVFDRLSRYTKVNTFAIHGGVELDPQIDELDEGVDILIATPGRMFELIRRQVIDISKISWLVLDEADRMLDLGFIDDIQKIKRMLNSKHQTLFFSATINPKIKKLAYSQIRSNALRIQISPEKQINKNIQHYIVKVPSDKKRNLLLNYVKAHLDSKCMIFLRTQVRVERYLDFLNKNKIPVYSIHGGMTQKERDKNLDLFRKSETGFILATDVTSRGIDLPGVTHVVNVDLPDDPEIYVHRIGRTGRGFNKGEAISFASPEEKEKLEAIEEFLQSKIDPIKIDQQFTEIIPEVDLSQSLSDMIAIEEALHEHPKKKRSKQTAKKKSK